MIRMSKNSKQKGNRYELKIAKEISKWWGADFHRVPASGGLGWGQDMRVAGDIVAPPNVPFPFVLELKNRETGNWTLESIMLNIHDIKHWWQQVVNDSRRVERVPCLIFTRNRAKDFIMIPYYEDTYNDLVEEGYPVQRTVVTYEEELSQQEESFDVLITTMEGFTSRKPKYWVEFPWGDWEEETRLSEPIKVDDTTVGDILNKLS